MDSDVTMLTSSVTSLASATLVTGDASNLSATEKPVEDFEEAKIATLIDRLYLPILASVGLVFNFLCFVTFVFTSLRTTSTCVYMAVIAVLDSIILVEGLCVLIRRYIGQAAFFKGNRWACGFQFFLFYFTIHHDVLILLAMTVDRFIVVKFPLKAQSWCTPRSALKVITGLGVFSFALNFHIFFNRRLIPSGNADDPEMCWYPAGDILFFMTKIYTIIDATVYSFVPFISLLTLNLLIIRQLRQAHQFSKQFTDNKDTDMPSNTKGVSLKTETVFSAGSNKGGVRKSLTSTNLNAMFLLVSFTFLLLTSPIVIALLYGRNVWQPKTNAARAQFRLTMACVDNLMYSNHAINFLLYCVSGRRFRQELGKLLSRFCCRS